ncbi:hypothetical protein BDN72DRAFT_198646 [Pluteus cervinus]|uniref:Uncharacterized protein n=1 Tax=Pluteus cervinus TaxID=181527 RepID=A0ACD3B6P0_9AGAR|nr:hypothetical protein BDN72DRAFT_198646 [Pluteus cervinus]
MMSQACLRRPVPFAMPGVCSPHSKRCEVRNHGDTALFESFVIFIEGIRLFRHSSAHIRTFSEMLYRSLSSAFIIFATGHNQSPAAFLAMVLTCFMANIMFFPSIDVLCYFRDR